jgi:hypothetical protein
MSFPWIAEKIKIQRIADAPTVAAPERASAVNAFSTTSRVVNCRDAVFPRERKKPTIVLSSILPAWFHKSRSETGGFFGTSV